MADTKEVPVTTAGPNDAVRGLVAPAPKPPVETPPTAPAAGQATPDAICASRSGG